LIRTWYCDADLKTQMILATILAELN